MKRIFLLSGRKGTGKNTSATIISNYFGKSAVDEIAFADPIKRFCIDCFALTSNQCYGTSGEREGPSPIRWEDIAPKFRSVKDSSNMTVREVLQIIGTDVLRSFYPDIWAHAGRTAAERSDKPVIVFTDTRFPNEILKLKELDSRENTRVCSIRILRDTKREDNHESETALDHWDRGHNIVSVDQLNSDYVRTELPNVCYRNFATKDTFSWVVDNNHGREKLSEAIKFIIKNEEAMWH